MAVTGCSLSRLLVPAFVLVCGAPAALAQTSYVKEFWPEIQLHYRLDESTRLIGLVNRNRYRDSDVVYQGEIGAAINHRFTDVISGRVGYRHGQATDGGPFRETG